MRRKHWKTTIEFNRSPSKKFLIEKWTKVSDTSPKKVIIKVRNKKITPTAETYFDVERTKYLNLVHFLILYLQISGKAKNRRCEKVSARASEFFEGNFAFYSFYTLIQRFKLQYI